VNVEPTPTRLLTQISPPCSSTNFGHRVSPSPVGYISCIIAWDADTGEFRRVESPEGFTT
jgi:hypothetical protein